MLLGGNPVYLEIEIAVLPVSPTSNHSFSRAGRLRGYDSLLRPVVKRLQLLLDLDD